MSEKILIVSRYEDRRGTRFAWHSTTCQHPEICPRDQDLGVAPVSGWTCYVPADSNIIMDMSLMLGLRPNKPPREEPPCCCCALQMLLQPSKQHTLLAPHACSASQWSWACSPRLLQFASKHGSVHRKQNRDSHRKMSNGRYEIIICTTIKTDINDKYLLPKGRK